MFDALKNKFVFFILKILFMKNNTSKISFSINIKKTKSLLKYESTFPNRNFYFNI